MGTSTSTSTQVAAICLSTYNMIPPPPPTDSFLLMETSGNILLEDNSRIVLE